MSGGMKLRGVNLRVMLAVLRHPELWWTGASVLFRLAEPGWWRHAPFLPLPPEAYVEFRLLTNYGSGGATGEVIARDVVVYLRWCRESRALR